MTIAQNARKMAIIWQKDLEILEPACRTKEWADIIETARIIAAALRLYAAMLEPSAGFLTSVTDIRDAAENDNEGGIYSKRTSGTGQEWAEDHMLVAFKECIRLVDGNLE